MGKELDMFIEIWKERPHYSEVSGEPLGSFNVAYFSHLLSKGAFPEHRLNKDNIMLKTIEEHMLWETSDREKLRKIPKWEKVFERYDKLKFNG